MARVQKGGARGFSSMTQRQPLKAQQTRRSIVRSGMLLGGGIAGLGAGVRLTGAQDGSPEASPAASPALVGASVTVYSGRTEDLIGPAIEIAEAATGITAEVRYGSTAELAATIAEEGENTPASLYIAQDAGALGQLANEGLLSELPEELLNRVDERFRSRDGLWVGISGRARVLVYNTDMVAEEELPTSVQDLTGEAWTGMVGWAPENGSFQAFVTAFRALEGDDAAREWLEGMIANDAQVYESNGAIVRAVAAGEVSVGLVNHYYKFEIEAEEGDLPIENHYFEAGDPGSLVNVAGVGVLANGPDQQSALAMVDALLSPEIQGYFAETTYEYPLIEGVETDEELLPLADVGSPDIDLSDLDDLEGTLELLAEAGAL